MGGETIEGVSVMTKGLDCKMKGNKAREMEVVDDLFFFKLGCFVVLRHEVNLEMRNA